jgi:hypothetical protein
MLAIKQREENYAEYFAAPSARRRLGGELI